MPPEPMADARESFWRKRAGASSREGELARRILRHRRQRDLLLGSTMFGEASWTMLLMLFIAHEEEMSLDWQSLTTAAGEPSEPARRRLEQLVAEGKVMRTGDAALISPAMAAQLRSLLRGWCDEER
jgi:hypothetical protein